MQLGTLTIQSTKNKYEYIIDLLYFYVLVCTIVHTDSRALALNVKKFVTFSGHNLLPRFFHEVSRKRSL